MTQHTCTRQSAQHSPDTAHSRQTRAHDTQHAHNTCSARHTHMALDTCTHTTHTQSADTADTRTAEHRQQARSRSATSQLSPPSRTTSEEVYPTHSHSSRRDTYPRTNPHTSAWPPAVGPWHAEPRKPGPPPACAPHQVPPRRSRSSPALPALAGGPSRSLGWAGGSGAGHLPSLWDQVSSSPVLALCHPLPLGPILDGRIPPQLGCALDADLQNLSLKFETNLILPLSCSTSAE